jgi:hypothetical protein
MPINEKAFLTLMVSRGEDLNRKIKADQNDLLSRFQNVDYFPLAIAHSLNWSGHALKENGYFESALDYFKTGDNKALEKCRRYNWRYDKPDLINALKAWKSVLTNSQKVDFKHIKAKEIQSAQIQILNVADRLRKSKTITGFGPWILFAPFKIVLAHRTDLWTDNEIETIILPLGAQVTRGINNMKRNGFDCAKNLEKNLFPEEGSGWDNDLTSVYIAQQFQTEIAKLHESRAIHVNSGLHLYGSGELE